MNKIVFVLTVLLLISCEEKSKFKDYSFKKSISLNRNHSLDVPNSLIKQMDKDFFDLSTRPVERTETQKQVALKNIRRKFLNFDAFFIDKGQVLSHSSILFNVEGGGEINLADYVKKGKKGNFLFGFLFDEKFNSSNTKVYFLPNLKSSGCDNYKDITGFFFNKILKKGLLTTTKDFIYLKLLSGAFIFISNIEDVYYMGQLYISDSQIKKLQCR